MRTVDDLKPETVLVVCTPNNPDFEVGVYLPPKAYYTRVNGELVTMPLDTLANVKRWLLDEILEKRQAIPLFALEHNEQLFMLKASLLCISATTVERFESVLEDAEKLRQAAEAKRRAEEEGTETSFALTGSTEGSDSVEVGSVTMEDFPVDPKTEDLMDDARSVQAELDAEDPRVEDEEEEPDVAPAWGAVEHPGPAGG
jgi:hypothetical protein